MSNSSQSAATAADLFARAVQAYQAGDHPAAVQLAQNLLQQYGAHAGALYLVGGAALDDNRPEEALTYLDRAAHLDDRNPDIQRALGNAQMQLEHWAEAAPCFDRALRTYPGDSGLLNNLGICCKELGKVDAAVECYRKALSRSPRDAHIYNNLGIALDKQRKADAAIEAYRQSLALDARNPAVWSNLAVLLEQANRTEEAAAAADAGLTLAPAHPALNATVAKLLRRQGDSAAAVGRLEPILSRPELPAGTRRDMLFELGYNYDTLGDTPAAYRCFDEANHLSLEAQPWLADTARAYLHELDSLLELFTADWVKTWIAKTRAAQRAMNEPPVAFLVGFLRAGTTLMDTLLGTRRGLAVLEEEPCLENTLNRLRAAQPAYPAALAGLAPAAWQTLRSDYWQAVHACLGTTAAPALILDKHPLMSAQAGYVHALLPAAAFVFALRHPCDVVLSCFMQSFNGSSITGNFLDLESSTQIYRRVMELWLRYREILELDVYELRYERLVIDPNRELSAACAFLGLDAAASRPDRERPPGARARVYTPSYAQIVQPVNARAVDRWQRYREYFGASLDTLHPWVKRFGYSL
ncbi:MAG: tetratricopeptide repeat protein [Gammaproteobacteria bacterium]